jgi:Glyoxalase/Bleomycin resistance protein/Dioxygenase superfamily
VANLDASKRFYQTVLEPLGLGLSWESDSAAEFFGLLYLSADKPPSVGVHLAFTASSTDQVKAFHSVGILAGYRSNGPPGERPEYHAGYYAAYLSDPDGNNVEAVFHAR